MNEIRFDLEDIIAGKLVDDILQSIDTMSKRVSIKKVIFWHNGKVTKKKISELKLQSDKVLHSDILVEVTDRSPQQEYAWYDVINEQKMDRSKSRYSYSYPTDRVVEMLRGIYGYYTVASFLETNGQRKRVYYKPKENTK